MKSRAFFIVLVILLSITTYSQTPLAFKYQAVARDNAGEIIANQAVSFRMSVIQGALPGMVIYTETHAVTTNEFGLATLEIGRGNPVLGFFNLINWSVTPIYLQTELDPAGGSSYVSMGTSEFLSVPYSIYSKVAESGWPVYSGGSGINVTGSVITNTQPNATHTGDATGNSALTVVKIQGRDVYNAAPSNGQILKWNSSNSRWQPTNEDNTTSSIKDTDADTRVQTEKNQDEDIIRFDLEGTERWIMEGAALKPKNSGNSVFIGDGAGILDDLTDNRNTFVGTLSGYRNTTGFRDVAVGNQALYYNTSGSYNTAVGNYSLYFNKANSRNTAMGYYSMYYADSTSVAGQSTYNTAFGYEALRGSSTIASNTGTYNTAVGDQAMSGISSGSFNTVMGKSTGSAITTGSQNVLIGAYTGDNITTGSNNLLIGYNIDAPSATANNQVVIGHTDLFYGDIDNKFIGIGTTTPHAPLQFANIAATRKIVLYESANNDHQFTGFGVNPSSLRYQVSSTVFDHIFYAGSSASSSDELMRIKGNGNVGIGVNPNHKLSVGGTLGIIETGTSPTYYTIFQGGNQSANLIYTLPVAYGTAGQVLSTTTAGVLSWTSAPAVNLIKDADGDTKIQVEESADEDKIRFDLAGTERWVMNGPRLETKNNGYSVFVGDSAGYNDDLVLNYNVFIGNKAGRNNSSGANNTAIGNESLNSSISGNHNTAIGNVSLLNNTTGSSNNAIGSNTLRANQTGSYNTALGSSALLQNISGNENSVLGNGAMYYNRAGSGAVAIGFNSMYYAYSNSVAFTNENVAVGYEALRGSTNSSLNTGNSNTAIGYQTMLNNTSGDQNTSVGYKSLFSNSTGYANAALGHNALNANTTGYANTATGPGALGANTSGDNNTACGSNSLPYNDTGVSNSAHGAISLFHNEDGSQNTAIGFSALYDNVSGNNNTAIGYNSGDNATGSGNVFLGAQAGENVTTGSYNIVVGYNVDAPSATGNNQLVLGSQDLLYGDITNGFIGIGTTSPNAPLQFGNTIESRKIVLYETNDNDHEFYGFGINSAVLRYQVSATSKAHVFYAGTSATTSDELMRISGNGNVKINNLTTNGTVYSNNGILTNVNPSDMTLKENISPFGSTLPLIMKLKPVTYNWKETDAKGIGFIAQEVEEVIPELVGTNNDGTKGIYSVEMIPYLVKALQEQQQLIEELKSRVDKLQKEE